MEGVIEMSSENKLPLLPEPDLGYIETDKSRQPAFSARQMREALAQQAQEPVAWLVSLPDEPEFGEWFSEQDMSAQGYTSKPLYTTPQPQPTPLAGEVTDDLVRETIKAIQDPDTVSAFHNGYYTLTPDELRRAILAMRTPTQPCGHPTSLIIRSAESGEALYCEACDDKSGRRDAEMREAELLEANQKLRDEILALRPQAEIDVRNTPFGKEAEKLAADYLALMSECAGLRDQLASLRPQAVPMTDEQAEELAYQAFKDHMEDHNDDMEIDLIRKVERFHRIGITAQGAQEGV